MSVFDMSVNGQCASRIVLEEYNHVYLFWGLVVELLLKSVYSYGTFLDIYVHT